MTKPIFAIKPGQFVDMHDLHLAAVIALRKAGLGDQARELRQRGMVMLTGEYMDVKQEPCRWT